jgi:hypothetical protein
MEPHRFRSRLSCLLALPFTIKLNHCSINLPLSPLNILSILFNDHYYNIRICNFNSLRRSIDIFGFSSFLDFAASYSIHNLSLKSHSPLKLILNRNLTFQLLFLLN